jgi:anion-transporting  ArsA/GET3 family ATPase
MNSAILDTPEQIATFRLLTLRQMLKLEMLGMTRRGRSAYSIIKQELGLKGSKQSVFNQLSELLGK